MKQRTPRSRLSASAESCTPRLPDCETMATLPGRGCRAMKPVACSCVALAMSPMQFGPMRVTPASAAARASSASASLPASPVSEKPAAMATAARTPAAPHCGITSGSWRAPTASRARSGGAGRSSSPVETGSPKNSPPLGFTG